MIKKLYILAIIFVATATFSTDLQAYTKKAPYAGYGKISTKTGRIKTKTVSGHTKKTSTGYTYVNPYAKS